MTGTAVLPGPGPRPGPGRDRGPYRRPPAPACAMLGTVQTRSVSPVFVGRAGELAALDSALTRAHAGEPQALLVGGEAGVGKTRLLEEFLCGARAAGAVAVVGRCVEIGAEGLPYQPISNALGALYRVFGGELRQAAAGFGAELARLLPDLGEATGDDHDEFGRVRLFELTARLLERLTEDRTVVLAIEDLHWSDRSTRELLAYLFRSLQRARLVLLATYRADDIHRRHPLRPFLAELDRLRSVRRIELSRLNREEVRRQLAGILRGEPGHALAERIFERSEGNPFFVEELACCLPGGGTTGLSDSLRDVLLVRLEALPERAQRIVRTAAEGGSEVEHRLLAAVAQVRDGDGDDGAELDEALRAAVGANILLPTDDGDGYRFRHALMREAVADDLLPGERVRINRRYAEALEADPTLVCVSARAGRLASYWYHAHDARKALPAVLRAAEGARRRHAHAERLHLLERAMELWEEVPEDDRQDLPATLGPAESYPRCSCHPADGPPVLHYVDLLAAASVAARLSMLSERGHTLVKRALELLDDRRDPVRAAWFWMQRSRLAITLGRGDGRAELARAEDLVRGLPPSAVHAEVLNQVAGWEMVHSPDGRTLSSADQAVQLARLVGAEDVEINARVTAASLRIGAGDERGVAELYELAGHAERIGATAVFGRAHCNLVHNLEQIGRSAEAVRVARGGLETTRRLGVRNATEMIAGNLVESLVSLGEWDEAQAVIDRERRESSRSAGEGLIELQAAGLALARGDAERAAALLDTARELFGLAGRQPQRALPMAEVGMGIAAAHGRYPEARHELLAVLDAGDPTLGHERYWWQLLSRAAAVEADGRGLPEMDAGRAEVLERLRTTARKVACPAPVWAAFSLLLTAELQRAHGRSQARLWAEAALAFEPLERPYPLARARFRQAEALLGAQDADRACVAGLLTRAHAVAERLGARPLGEEIALLADRARVRLDEPGPAAPAEPEQGAGAAASLGLTPRERDVLRLVAAGRSNRGIAEELFISPKTASVHVSNILAKLGVSGRGEAAAVAHRLRLFADDPAEAAG